MLIGIGAAMIAAMAIAGRKAFKRRKKRSQENTVPRSSVNSSLPRANFAETAPKESLPFPRHLRRLQQYFKRQDKIMMEKAKDLIYDQKELAFRKLIIEAAEDSIDIRDARVLLNKEMLEIEKAHFEVEKKETLHLFREENLNLYEEALRLQRDELNIDRKINEIELGEKRVQLGIQELNVIQKANVLQLDQLSLELKEIQRNIEHAEKKMGLKHERMLIELDQKKLDDYAQNLKYSFEIGMEKLRIKGKDNEISYREKKAELEQIYHRTTLSIDKLRWVSQNEKSHETFLRQEEYFRKFLHHHFEWIGLL